ncbi:3 isoform X2 [Octopus vulgaris]|uniref:3 isoform X2 n=1 Tax=Octopus vulgaris TaxID=6645 RepID=A0AA36FDV4_OCTVU|nr:3 isoform X2 [Octopus vulgaris]
MINNKNDNKNDNNNYDTINTTKNTTTIASFTTHCWIYYCWLFWCLVTVLPQIAVADYWSDWSEWSLCSRTCGGGSSYRLRKCIQSFLPQHTCKGDSIQYTTCNNEMCPNPTDDFRAQQCTAYDDKMYFGQYFTWIPYRNPSDPCSLYCLAIQGNIVKSLAPKVLDGTRCNAQTLDMCINGKCWPVGCDHELNSEKQLDQCGVCGGNNSCITSTPLSTDGDQVTDTDVINRKLSDIKDRKSSEKPFDGSHLKSDENNDQRQQYQQQQRHHHHREQESQEQQRQQQQQQQQQQQEKQQQLKQQQQQELQQKLQQQQDEEIVDGDSQLVKMQMKRWRKKKKDKELYRWEVKYGECSVTCSLGVRQPKKVCLDTKASSVVDNEHCTSLDDIQLPQPKNCSTQKCPPRWEAQEWQPCTMTCGGGTSLREVSCMEYGPSGQARWVEDQFCKQLQPSEYKSCNTDICPRWYAGEWSPCSVTCGFGIQHRVVICRNSGNNTCEEEEKPTTSQTCTTNLPCFERSGDIQETLLTDYIESSPPKYGLAPNISKLDLSAPRFIPYDWSPCSVTCGTGVKTRRVPCKIFLQFLNEVTEVPHKECIGRVISLVLLVVKWLRNLFEKSVVVGGGGGGGVGVVVVAARMYQKHQKPRS